MRRLFGTAAARVRQLNRLDDRARYGLQGKLEGSGEADAAAHLPERWPYSLDQVLGCPRPGSWSGSPKVTGIRRRFRFEPEALSA